MISIIIPVFNVEEYLPRCLDSVLNQTYSDLEIILVNDGSTDNSGEICDRYAENDSRIKVIHKENGGVSSARNTGLDMATGEFIGFVDGDDVLDLKMYEVLISNARKYNCDISCCQLATIDIDGTKKAYYDNESAIFEKDYLIKNYFFDEFVKDTMYSQCNKIFKKDIIENLRYKPYRYCEDILFIFESLSRAKSMYYDKFIGYYYVHRERSAMTSTFSEKRLDYISAAREIENMCKEKFEYAYSNAKKWVYIHVMNTLRQIYVSKKKNEFKNFIAKEKIYLKIHSRECLPQLPFKKKIDYLAVMYFPVYFTFITKIKEFK